MKLRISIFLMALGLLAACGPTSLNLNAEAPTASLTIAGADQGNIAEVTDLDTVNDVSAAGNRVLVATDRGILVYANGASEPRRITRADGLPSNDVWAIAVGIDGRVLLATEGGMAGMAGDTLDAVVPEAPPVGQVVDLHLTDEGTLWACGTDGMAFHENGTWRRFGESVTCTGIFPTLEGKLWIGTVRGALFVDGNVIREHAPGRGIPEPYVRDILPMPGGAAFVIAQGPNASRLGFFDGARWYSYSVRGLDRKLVGLGRAGANALLFTPGNTFLIASAQTGEGVPLVATQVGPSFGVRSYEARITSAADFVPNEAARPDLVRLAPVPLASLPAQSPTYPAPGFVIRPVGEAPQGLYLVRHSGDQVFLADRNRGILAMGNAGQRELRSSDLVSSTDLQVAVDQSNQSWVLSRDGDLARWDGEGFVREASPAEVAIQSIATGPQGAYAAGQVGDTNTVRVFRRTEDGWAQVAERELPTEEEFLGVPIMAVSDEGAVWVALAVRQGASRRIRGVAVINPASEAVVYHHRGASAEGEFALQDEITSIDLHQTGMAWFASFHGAQRLGGSQVVVFNEARGVRGEIVTDLAVDGERVWIAAAEGLGYYEDQQMRFLMPELVRDARPSALAVDPRGGVWAIGHRGAFFFDGTNWTRVGSEQGMPGVVLVDVEVDRQGRTWFLAEDRLMLMER